MDPVQWLADHMNASPGVRFRQGEVVSVSSYGLTLKVAGSTQQITGVKYLGSYAPRAGAHVWLVTDGSDMFAIGHIAPRGVPALRVTGAATSLANATETALAFNAETGTDPWAMWVVGSATRITVPLDGWYVFTAWASFAANATGVRGIRVRQGGSTTLAWSRVPATGAGTTEVNVVTGPVSLSATNYVELVAEQTSGGALNVTPVMGVQYVGPAE